MKKKRRMTPKRRNAIGRSKHQKIVNNLESKLGNKHYVESAIANYEYDKGECDVLTYQGHRLIYYEVKSNYSDYSLRHGEEQLVRWSKYAYIQNGKTINCYGIYYSPTKIKIVAKNGVLRI